MLTNCFPLKTGIDFVQEKFLKQGPQDNESAAEQAKDKLIADAIRNGYKNATGNEFPIKEKKNNNSSSSNNNNNNNGNNSGNGNSGGPDLAGLGKKFGLF